MVSWVLFLKGFTNLVQIFPRDFAECQATEMVSGEPENASLWGKYQWGSDRVGELWIWGSQPTHPIAPGSLARLSSARDKGRHLLSLFPPLPLTPGCHPQNWSQLGRHGASQVLSTWAGCHKIQANHYTSLCWPLSHIVTERNLWVWLLTTPKAINRSGWWKGKFVLFQSNSPGRGWQTSVQRPALCP